MRIRDLRFHAAVRLAVLFLVLLATAAGATVNKSIHVDDGEIVDRELSSVNGSIHVGSGADLGREAETVNGSIQVAADVRTRDLSSVNGTVQVGDRVTVDGDLSTVNGSLVSGEDTVVTGNVETVNGTIELTGTTVERNLETINGEITLDRGSRVMGDLVIEETNSRGWNKRRKPLEIELRGGSVIEGDIDVRDEDRKVIVRLSGGSEVRGEIRGAEVIRE